MTKKKVKVYREFNTGSSLRPNGCHNNSSRSGSKTCIGNQFEVNSGAKKCDTVSTKSGVNTVTYTADCSYTTHKECHHFNVDALQYFPNNQIGQHKYNIYAKNFCMKLNVNHDVNNECVYSTHAGELHVVPKKSYHVLKKQVQSTSICQSTDNFCFSKLSHVGHESDQSLVHKYQTFYEHGETSCGYVSFHNTCSSSQFDYQAEGRQMISGKINIACLSDSCDIINSSTNSKNDFSENCSHCYTDVYTASIEDVDEYLASQYLQFVDSCKGLSDPSSEIYAPCTVLDNSSFISLDNNTFISFSKDGSLSIASRINSHYVSNQGSFGIDIVATISQKSKNIKTRSMVDIHSTRGVGDPNFLFTVGFIPKNWVNRTFI